MQVSIRSTIWRILLSGCAWGDAILQSHVAEQVGLFVLYASHRVLRLTGSGNYTKWVSIFFNSLLAHFFLILMNDMPGQ